LIRGSIGRRRRRTKGRTGSWRTRGRRGRCRGRDFGHDLEVRIVFAPKIGAAVLERWHLAILGTSIRANIKVVKEVGVRLIGTRIKKEHNGIDFRVQRVSIKDIKQVKFNAFPLLRDCCEGNVTRVTTNGEIIRFALGEIVQLHHNLRARGSIGPHIHVKLALARRKGGRVGNDRSSIDNEIIEFRGVTRVLNDGESSVYARGDNVRTGGHEVLGGLTLSQSGRDKRDFYFVPRISFRFSTAV
jgi:hypothetical protein